MPVESGRTRRRAELSQHFLRKGAKAAELVQSTSISDRDLVLEIGAGRGALTRELLDRCSRLIAVEIDAELAVGLRREFGSRAEIVDGDFLALDLPRRPYKVMGSLPFSRTTEIVRRLTEAVVAPEDAWLVVQREAAHRIAGSPYAHETLWSLRLKPWWHCEVVRTLRRTDFDPPPAVDSVLLWLMHRRRALVDASDARFYRDFLGQIFRAGVGSGKSLRPWLTGSQITRLARDLRFHPALPPSALRFDQWLSIFRFVARSPRA